MTGRTYPVAYATQPNDVHWRPGEVTWDEILQWVQHPASRKACGNYILATLRSTEKVHSGTGQMCTGVHRDNRSVVRRSAILAMDVDTPEDGFELQVELALARVTYIMHTTYSSLPEKPRYRLLVQTDRDMAPDEYVAATTALATRLGADSFDTGTFQPARFMFKPAAQRPEWYDYWTNDGAPLRVDELLGEFEDHLGDKPMPKPGKNKRDPFEIEGVIGAFNRAYDDWDLLIETFKLPYDKVGDDRYQLHGARSEAGMGPVAGAPGFVFSHHANDPAYEKTCSAFDLVRLHWFGTLDENAKPDTPVNKLASHVEMLDVARADARTVQEMFKADFADAPELAELEKLGDEIDWRGSLAGLVRRDGILPDKPKAWDILRANDPLISSLRYNDLAMAPEWELGELPWRKIRDGERSLNTTDRTELQEYLHTAYNYEVSQAKLDLRINAWSFRRRYNPVREYLAGLHWDGRPRLETALPGVEADDYARMVARKCLMAAVARVFQPGCKWDHTLVLYGDEGLGKTHWIERMSRGWSANLPGNFASADGLRLLHMNWIMVSDEGHSMRRADFEALKEFLTRTRDSFRLPYSRDFDTVHRQSVIWSTTNDRTFLRREVGNRRFLVVHCRSKVDFEALSDDYIDQVWAEAVALYRSGTEPLFLSGPEEELAKAVREEFTEEDVLTGYILSYVDRLVPPGWGSWTRGARLQWLGDQEHGFGDPGTERVERVCSAEILELALGRRYGDEKPGEMVRITNALKHLPGWVPVGIQRTSSYGDQLVFVRTEDLL